MTFDRERCRAIEGRASDQLDTKRRNWEAGRIDEELAAKHYYGVAGRHRTVANCRAFLGDGDGAREAYESAAASYTRSVHERREWREELSPDYWDNEPAVASRALTTALLARSDEALADAAAEALATDEAYLERFEPEYDDAAFAFYNAKLRGAIAAEDDEEAALLDAYEDAVDEYGEPYPDAMGDVYAGIVRGDEERTERGLHALLGYHDESVTASTDHPDDYVADTPTALALLARDRGQDVTLRSEYVPDAIVPWDSGPGPFDDPPEIDEGASADGPADFEFPRVERDTETDEYVLVHEHDEVVEDELSREDLPETEYGRVFSEEWVDAVVRVLESGDDPALQRRAEELREARAEGRLRRELQLVHAGEGIPFDGSLSELVDDVSVLKRDAE